MKHVYTIDIFIVAMFFCKCRNFRKIVHSCCYINLFKYFFLDDNLSGLNYQLRRETVDLIINILSAVQSSYIRQFLILKDEIEHGTIEAKSNIKFLSILKDTLAELKTCTTPASVAQYLPKMMHLFRTIWLNSPFYNTRERISNLFTALSNQIVVMCKGFINLADVFAGKTRKSIKIFYECIKLCEDYITLYYEVKLFENIL